MYEEEERINVQKEQLTKVDTLLCDLYRGRDHRKHYS